MESSTGADAPTMDGLAAREHGRVAGGKFLTFGVADEEYGVPIHTVQEIVGALAVTPLPDAPPHVLGVVNLRGAVIPVLDMGARLGHRGHDRTEGVIVVVNLGRQRVGLSVDRVCEVTQIDRAMIEVPPALGADASPLILGLAKTEGRVRVLLDLTHVVLLDGAPSATVAADEPSAAA
jgi:purine-binding chemotaxis protein CheW